MEVHEIFSELINHSIQGLMFHDQMANYYKFLGLDGYAECHEYHFLKETCGYRKLQKYFICHYNKLVPETRFDNPDVIPDSWYNYTRQDVDAATKKNAVKSGLTEWVAWETTTKDLYQRMYKELYDLGEIATAMFIQEYIQDVTEEHAKAQGYLLDKMAIGFNIDSMIAEQKSKHKKYKKRLEEYAE